MLIHLLKNWLPLSSWSVHISVCVCVCFGPLAALNNIRSRYNSVAINFFFALFHCLSSLLYHPPPSLYPILFALFSLLFLTLFSLLHLISLSLLLCLFLSRPFSLPTFTLPAFLSPYLVSPSAYHYPSTLLLARAVLFRNNNVFKKPNTTGVLM